MEKINTREIDELIEIFCSLYEPLSQNLAHRISTLSRRPKRAQKPRAKVTKSRQVICRKKRQWLLQYRRDASHSGGFWTFLTLLKRRNCLSAHFSEPGQFRLIQAPR